MWVVVVFVAGDVSAVPLSWILVTDGKIMCYWPLNNPRDKIKKNCKPPESQNEYWQLYKCRVLFDGGKISVVIVIAKSNFYFFFLLFNFTATFKSYKMAIQNEMYGQKHSNLESQEESDYNRAKRRKYPKTKFSCDSDEEVPRHTKRPKLISKCGEKSTKLRKQSSKSSRQPLSSDDDEYVFIKSPPKSSQNVLHNATVEPMLERDETPTPFVGGGILDSVGDPATTNDQHIEVIFVNDDVNQTPKSIRDVVDNADENPSDELPVNTRDEFGSLEQHIETIFENDDENQANETTDKTSDIVQLDSDPVHSNSSGTENIVLESIDFSDHIGGTILQKLSEVLKNQNDFKKVLVDLTYRTMKLEQQIKKLSSTPTKAIIKQLGCPVKSKEKFAETQVALEDDENYDNLVSS